MRRAEALVAMEKNVNARKGDAAECAAPGPTWRSVKRVAGTAAVSSLLVFMAAKTAVAQSMEKLKSRCAVEERQLEEVVGIRGTARPFGETRIRTLDTGVGDVVVVGYDNSRTKGKVTWIMLDTKGSALRFIDSDNDGRVDRVIHNNSTSSTEKKSGFNDMVGSEPMDVIAMDAEVQSQLKPSDKSVVSISDGTNPTIRSVSYKDGKATELHGEDALQTAKKIQNEYLKALEDVNVLENVR